MIDYPDHVAAGDVVRNHVTGEAYDVTGVRYRVGRGWEVTTRTVDGYSGPTFWPDMDRMPSPDLPTVADLLMAP